MSGNPVITTTVLYPTNSNTPLWAKCRRNNYIPNVQTVECKLKSQVPNYVHQEKIKTRILRNQQKSKSDPASARRFLVLLETQQQLTKALFA
jgi:hypothetical protein